MKTLIIVMVSLILAAPAYASHDHPPTQIPPIVVEKPRPEPGPVYTDIYKHYRPE